MQFSVQPHSDLYNYIPKIIGTRIGRIKMLLNGTNIFRKVAYSLNFISNILVSFLLNLLGVPTKLGTACIEHYCFPKEQ